MTKRVLAAVPVLGLVLSGCEGPTAPRDGVVCTLIAVSSLNVTVRDAATTQRICDATVIAVQGGTSYELRRAGTSDSCTYAGPEERPGAFEVRASRAGYATVTVGDVRVGADECHVIPVQLAIDLRPSS